MASDPIESLSSSEGVLPSSSDNGLASPVTTSKLQYVLPTELLQRIFMELDTIDDVKAITHTCQRMQDAFMNNEKNITWAILCRDLGTTFLATIGALAIFVAPRKGPVDERLSAEPDNSPEYWLPMLMDHGKLAKELITLKMADQMLCVYRQFPKKIGYRPSGRCSTCGSSMLSEEAWDPLRGNPKRKCLEYLLHGNAVHFRLRCRMVLGYEGPAQTPKHNSRAMSWV